MKRILLICSLTFSSNIFAGQNDSFEKEYLKIMEESNIAQHAELRFKEISEGKILTQAEKIESQRLKCSSLMNEFKFYELVTKYPKEYVTYMKRQGVSVDSNLSKIHGELREVKQKISFNGCNDNQVNY